MSDVQNQHAGIGETRAVGPAVLWHQAEQEHSDDSDARRARYLDLMREHGHVVKREPGDDSPLFSCGYTGWRSRFPRAVERPHRVSDPRRLVGSITHGGPNQWKCGPCDGAGGSCPECNGEGWYVLTR